MGVVMVAKSTLAREGEKCDPEEGRIAENEIITLQKCRFSLLGGKSGTICARADPTCRRHPFCSAARRAPCATYRRVIRTGWRRARAARLRRYEAVSSEALTSKRKDPRAAMVMLLFEPGRPRCGAPCEPRCRLTSSCCHSTADALCNKPRRVKDLVARGGISGRFRAPKVSFTCHL